MFGQAPAPAPAASTSFGFGSNSTSSAPKATFSFGAPAQASTSAAPASSFGFGAASTAQPQAGQAQGGGGLFGQQPVQGQQQQQQQQAGGLFGGQQQQQPAQGAQGGTSLFGQPQSQPAQGGGLFAQPSQGQAQAQPSGGLFGQSQPQGQAQGSSLFGNTSTTQPATSSFGTFGAASTTQPSTGLFGSTTAASQAKPSLFGAQSVAPSGGLFGSTAGQSSIFGQPQQQQQQQQPQQQGSLFGQSTSQPFGQALPQAPGLGQSQFQQLGQSVGPNAALGQSTLRQKSIEERLQEVQAGWDTNNPNCRFKHFFYNQVAPGTASQYGRPPNATEALWDRAKTNNPDQTRFVPTLAVGFEDVKKRAAAQKKEAEGQHRRISELSSMLDQLSRANTSRAALRLAAMQNTLAQLQKRLIALIARVPGFVEPATGAANQQLDNSTRARLLEIKGDLEGKRAGASAQMSQGLSYSARGPGTPTGRRAGTGADRAQTQRLMGQVNELWGAVDELRRRRAFGTRNGDKDARDGWLADEKALAEVANILGQHQLALHKLTEMLDEAQFDVGLIKEAVKRG